MIKYIAAITGTMISSAFMVAFLRSTIMADKITRITVVMIGGTEKAFLKAEATELLITWLMPHQHKSPDKAKKTAITECSVSFHGLFLHNSGYSKPDRRDSRRTMNLPLYGSGPELPR